MHVMPLVDCEFYVDLRGLLKAKGLSIRDLSDMTGLEYYALYRLINQEREYYNRKLLGRVLLTLGIKPQPPFYLRTTITEGENQDETDTTTDRKGNQPTHRRRADGQPDT